MKRISIALLAIMLLFTLPTSAIAQVSAKAQKRIAYTLKHLKLDANQQKAAKPLLASYLGEVKKAKQKYADLKDKYKANIDKGTLTDNAAQALLQAKFEFEAKEAGIKQTYLKKLAAVMPYKKVYYCYDLINDKMSKIEGKKTSKDEEDD